MILPLIALPILFASNVTAGLIDNSTVVDFKEVTTQVNEFMMNADLSSATHLYDDTQNSTLKGNLVKEKQAVPNR